MGPDAAWTRDELLVEVARLENEMYRTEKEVARIRERLRELRADLLLDHSVEVQQF